MSNKTRLGSVSIARDKLVVHPAARLARQACLQLPPMTNFAQLDASLLTTWLSRSAIIVVGCSGASGAAELVGGFAAERIASTLIFRGHKLKSINAQWIPNDQETIEMVVQSELIEALKMYPGRTYAKEVRNILSLLNEMNRNVVLGRSNLTRKGIAAATKIHPRDLVRKPKNEMVRQSVLTRLLAG